MFQKIIKSIITVFVIAGCIFVVLLGVIHYWYTTEDLDYRLREIAIGEIQDVEVIPLGKTYGGAISENGSFYEVCITYKNTGNYSADHLSIDWKFVESGPGYTDSSADVFRLFGYPQGTMRCVPGGKEGIIKRVIELRDDFESAKIIYTDGYTNKEQVIDLEITER